MSERTKLTGLLGVVAVLLCIGLVYSVRLTAEISHMAQAEQPPPPPAAQAHNPAAAQAHNPPASHHG